MRPLSSSLPPAEVADLLDVSPRLVHALMDDGRVLCHVHEGEPRIPLAQLEEFFRDALMRLYRAEAAPVERQAPPPVDVLRQTTAPVDVERQARAPVSPLPVSPPEPPVVSPVVVPAPLAPDQRRVQRYVPRHQIDGIFDDVKFTIVQISGNGLRIRHKEALIPGGEGKLTFALLKSARSVMIRTRVVWTSLARSGDEHFSISGLRVIEHPERLEQAVAAMLAAHELQPERRERRRRGEDGIAQLASASDDEIAMITAAMQKFAVDPVEASRWYSRGRFALADEEVRRAAPRKPSDREQVLAIWEYLERQVDLEKVAGVVSLTRSAH